MRSVRNSRSMAWLQQMTDQGGPSAVFGTVQSAPEFIGPMCGWRCGGPKRAAGRWTKSPMALKNPDPSNPIDWRAPTFGTRSGQSVHEHNVGSQPYDPYLRLAVLIQPSRPFMTDGEHVQHAPSGSSFQKNRGSSGIKAGPQAGRKEPRCR